MGSLAQGLRRLYGENGHYQAWIVDDSTGEAKGNPLIGNADATKLRKSHRVMLALIGDVNEKARPITAAQVCEHASRFWCGSKTFREKGLNCIDVLLHAVLVIGLNMGMRFDEIGKLEVCNVSLVAVYLTLALNEAIKYSTEKRTYTGREWPGNSALRFSMFMDPTLALLAWLLHRGSAPGPLFCDVNQTKEGFTIGSRKAWSSKKFTDFL